MNNKIEVIGIDHGWSNIKTATQVFVTGVKEITTEPALFDGVLEYQGKYYKVGGGRQEVRSTKTEDDTFYLWTLAAVAKELKRRGLCEARVFLAVGLPLTRFGSEKADFIKYLTAEKDIEFLFENIKYHIIVENAAVFPQCYAAVFDKLMTFGRKTLIVDIGSWTIDIMPVEDKAPNEAKCVTIPKGLITCMRTINEQCVRQLNGELDESYIQEIMRTGRCEIDRKYYDIAKAEIEAFCERVYNSIREYGYNLSTTPIVFVGGGASVMKLFGGISQNNITYITDIRANAKGFEQLATTALRKAKKLANELFVGGSIMVGRFFAGLGNVLVAILKAIAWLMLNALQLVLNVAKVFLLLLGLVGRVFLAFVRAGTPITSRNLEQMITKAEN